MEDTSHMWLLNSWKVASETDTIIITFLFNLNLDLNSCMRLVATTLDSTVWMMGTIERLSLVKLNDGA